MFVKSERKITNPNTHRLQCYAIFGSGLQDFSGLWSGFHYVISGKWNCHPYLYIWRQWHWHTCDKYLWLHQQNLQQFRKTCSALRCKKIHSSVTELSGQNIFSIQWSDSWENRIRYFCRSGVFSPLHYAKTRRREIHDLGHTIQQRRDGGNKNASLMASETASKVALGATA